MRSIDANTLRALRGSRSGDKVTAWVWYDGKLAYPKTLPISTWAFDFDITRQVQTFTCQVADVDGKLAPWLLDDPLGVGGAELQVRYEVGDAGIINMGWYRIGRNLPAEKWRTYIIDQSGAVHPGSAIPPNKALFYVSGGATIAVTAYDRALNAKRDRLIAPESPPVSGTPTIISEITRLMRDVAPVVAGAGVTDRNVSKLIVYERERLDAIQDLAKRIFCDYRMNGDGQMEIYPVAEAAPVATLEGGPGGLLVGVDREQNLEGLNNVFVVDGQKENADGTTTPVRAVDMIESGALSAYGPHKRSAEFYASNMIQNEDDAAKYAFEMKVTQLSGLTVDLMVTCLPMPHIQQGDWVVVANPIVGGRSVSLIGKVKAGQLSGAASPKEMSLVVQCSAADVEMVMSGVKRG